MKKNFNYSKLVVIIAAINIILAVLALLKDMVMASYFGTTVNADAFSLSFFITDMLGNNLIANAVAVSCIPFFTKIYGENEDHKLYDNLIAVNVSFSIITGISVLVLLLFRNEIISKLAGGFTTETRYLCIQLLVILLPTILFYPIVTSGISYLQVRGKFIVSSLATVVFNFVFLLGISYCIFLKIPVSKGIFLVAYSVLAAVLAMVVLVYWKIIKEKKPIRDKNKKPLIMKGEVFKLFIPYCIILVLSQFVLYYERYLASFFQVGSVAALNYAYRLSQFPIWVFVSAIVTVLFPKMAKHSSDGDLNALNEAFKNALIWVFILTMPVIFILYILRTPIVSILFLRGAFNKTSLKITSEILSGYSLAIIGQSISALCLKVYLAREEVRKPVIIFIITSLINIILDLFLVGRIGIEGIGYGAAISSIINATVMLLFVKLEFKNHLYQNSIKFVRCIIPNFIIIIICIFGKQIWNLTIVKMNVLLQFGFVGAIVLLSVSLYVISLKFLKVF